MPSEPSSQLPASSSSTKDNVGTSTSTALIVEKCGQGVSYYVLKGCPLALVLATHQQTAKEASSEPPFVKRYSIEELLSIANNRSS